MEEILLTKEGYDQFTNILGLLEKNSKKNGINTTEACVNAVGDGWHDNFAFEALIEDERKLNYQINKMNQDKTKIKIIKDNYKENHININDLITLKFIYTDDYEIEKLLLTGKYLPNDNEITLNSPLGKAIYKKKIGDIVEYKVSDNIIKVEIININKLTN